MKQFTHIDRKACQQIRDLVDTHLAAINEDSGLHVVAGNMSFDPREGTATLKLDISVRDADGTVRTKEAKDFQRCAEAGWWVGINADDLGKTIDSHRGPAVIVGAKPQSYKYPILIQRGGKTYKITAHDAARYLANGRAA